MLAHQHAAPWSQWGGGSSWIGDCAVDPTTAPDAAAFYGARFLELADRCELRGPVEALTDRVGAMIPRGPAGAGPWRSVVGKRPVGE